MSLEEGIRHQTPGDLRIVIVFGSGEKQNKKEGKLCKTKNILLSLLCWQPF